MKIIRLPYVIEMTGLSRSTIYRLISKGQFPAQLSLSERSRGWIHAEVITWITRRIEERDQLGTCS